MIGIRMYQKRILPSFVITSTISPQASSPLERYGRTDNMLHPLLPKFFFFPLSARGDIVPVISQWIFVRRSPPQKISNF